MHQETPNFLASKLWPPNSPVLNPVDYESGLACSIVSTANKSIMWMNWNGGSSMSDAVLNSRFLMRLLTSGEEDIEHVSMLNEDISSTACELTMLLLFISVTFHVTCSTVASLITKSCHQRCVIHSCSFYKVVHLQIWGMVIDFMVHVVIVNFCLQQWNNCHGLPMSSLQGAA